MPASCLITNIIYRDDLLFNLCISTVQTVHCVQYSKYISHVHVCRPEALIALFVLRIGLASLSVLHITHTFKHNIKFNILMLICILTVKV